MLLLLFRLDSFYLSNGRGGSKQGYQFLYLGLFLVIAMRDSEIITLIKIILFSLFTIPSHHRGARPSLAHGQKLSRYNS